MHVTPQRTITVWLYVWHLLKAMLITVDPSSVQSDIKWKCQLNFLYNQWVKHLRCCCRDCLYLNGSSSQAPLGSGRVRRSCKKKWVLVNIRSSVQGRRGVCRVWHRQKSPCHSLSYRSISPSTHLILKYMSSVYITYEIECSSQFKFLPGGSKAVGLTAWEATANLSLRDYLLYATIHELRHRRRGRCVVSWVAADGRKMEPRLIKHAVWKNLRLRFKRMT